MYIFQLTIKNEVDQKVYDFDAAIWVRVDAYQDFWKELPVKKPDQLEGTQLETINEIYNLCLNKNFNTCIKGCKSCILYTVV